MKSKNVWSDRQCKQSLIISFRRRVKRAGGRKARLLSVLALHRHSISRAGSQDHDRTSRDSPSAPRTLPVTEPLTRREKEVLRLLAQGLTNAQISQELTITAHTVHAHIRSIYNKLGIATRSAATRYALEHRLL